MPGDTSLPKIGRAYGGLPDLGNQGLPAKSLICREIIGGCRRPSWRKAAAVSFITRWLGVPHRFRPALDEGSKRGRSSYSKHGRERVVLVTILNERSEPIHYSFMDYKLVDDDGFVYDYGMVMTSKPGLDTSVLAPGQQVKGYVSFSIPPAIVPAQVKYEPWLDYDSKAWLALWSE